VFVDAFEHALRERERLSPLRAGDVRGAPRARGVEERFDLGAQGLHVGDVEVADVDAGPSARGVRRHEAADGGSARGVVHGDVVVRLEKPHLANLLRPDARGRDVRHRAGRELDARVGGVHAVREDGDADGAHVRHLDPVPDEPEHDVEVVNHQVEHHVNVERPGGELADAVNLEVDGVADVRAERDERRVEAFEVADLQERAAALG
jgi:hypothetical protein